MTNLIKRILLGKRGKGPSRPYGAGDRGNFPLGLGLLLAWLLG